MSARGERRQRIRHKVHTPVYASFSGPSQGMVLDLSELLDLHEDGFAVRTGETLELNRPVNVCLDLPETKSYIHGTGHIVWSDGSGRAGVRLSTLADEQRRLLKEWLFINLLIAATNHKARAEQRALVTEESAEVPATTSRPMAAAPVADLSSLLFAVDAVRRELRSYKGDVNAILQFVTERALSLTGASGAALALGTRGEVVCRATAGQPAPPLQSVVDVKRGFSGECIRIARTTICEDAETDPRVDGEICRILGIRSIMATPIFSGVRAVGLLEVLSSNPRTFAKLHETVLEKLAELVPAPETPPSQDPPREETVSEHGQDARPMAEQPSTVQLQLQEPLAETSVRWGRLFLLAAAVAVAALALGYVLAPSIEKRWFAKPETAVQAASPDTSSGSDRRLSAPVSLQELRARAETGDADAQWTLGVQYHNGEGVPQDDSEATQWFLRAAEQGHVIAQATMGAYYWAGRGVPQDLSKAYFWSALALARGDEGSKSRLEGLASQMTRAEISAARQQADDWIRQHARKVKSD
jgi:hypothetical protein